MTSEGIRRSYIQIHHYLPDNYDCMVEGKEPGKETEEEGTNLNVLRQALTGNLSAKKANAAAKNNNNSVKKGVTGNDDDKSVIHKFSM